MKNQFEGLSTEEVKQIFLDELMKEIDPEILEKYKREYAKTLAEITDRCKKKICKLKD
jgi:hypothetical protein